MRAWLLVAVPVAVVLALVMTFLSPWGPVAGNAGGAALPDSVAGLGARADGASQRQVDDLAERLRADPAVAGVAVGAYDGDGVSVVVLRLSPRRPFDDETAGRLTAQVLGASGTATGPDGWGATGGSAPDPVFRTGDGDALLTCRSSGPASSTCVAVEAREALLVLTSGPVEDPLTLAATVRDDVRAG